MRNGDVFSEQNLKIAWNQCRKYNYKNFENMGLKFEENFYDKNIDSVIKDISIKIKNRQYKFSYKSIFYTPKKSGLLRRISFCALQDQIVLQAILNYVGKSVDKKFIENSFGNRVQYKRSKLSADIYILC